MNSLHTFHIPVMGLAYTIDSPVKVARYGIDSVISIIEDRLIESMRKYYYEQRKEVFTPISSRETDYRAKRITDYLNLVNRIVQEQITSVKNSAFEAGSEIVKYFEMLPSDHMLRQLLRRVLETRKDIDVLQNFLRDQVVPGAIDVNIMTKVDKDNPDRKGQIIPDSSDALAALRGYAKSDLRNSSIVFSAGMNPRLFNYLEQLREFDARAWGVFDKKIVIKVSDYRSALIQGKYLAKKGIWVSEFRIESGLNCGGHAFATDGNLMGPILEEFKVKRKELIDSLFTLYKPAAEEKCGIVFDRPHPVRITAQGGIGTAGESEFLLSHYQLDSTGWGTPFLLCPEATTVDSDTLAVLLKAREKDVVLSKSSPLGVRFNYLKGTSAEKERLFRIRKNSPGSPCTEKFLVSNTEFTKEPICTASRTYQWHKINQLKSLNLPEEEYAEQYESIVNKECLCIGLSNAAMNKYGLPTIKHLAAVTVCPGPNIAYFDRTVSLSEMTDHIYGRVNVLALERPHMFIKELDLNISYLQEQIEAMKKKQDEKALKDGMRYCDNLLSGIGYYRAITPDIFKTDESGSAEFNSSLDVQEFEIRKMRSWLTNAFE